MRKLQGIITLIHVSCVFWFGALRLASSSGSAPKGPVSIIVYIMDLSACGTAVPVTTPQAVMAFLGTTQPQNLAGYYNACTMGGVSLNVTGSVAYNVPYPCAGGGILDNKDTFKMDSCNNNVIPWQNYAENYVITKLGVNLAPFAHRVILLPMNFHDIMTGCNFAALSFGYWSATAANQAAGNNFGYGYIWMGGINWNDIPVWAHELGHNMGFAHSRSEILPWIGNTSDYSDPMSSWGGNQSRCYNAPHMWNAGWATPTTTLSAPSVVAPARFITMPMQNAAETTGIKILGAADATFAFALSFRDTNAPYDRPFINQKMTQGIMVYRVPSGIIYTDTALVGSLFLVGDSWYDPVTLLEATLVSIYSGYVTVALCTRVSPQVSCYTGDLYIAVCL